MSGNKWDNIIRARRSWLDIDLKSLWQYRDLCVMFVKRNFVTTYRQTLLGPLWFLISPILTIVIYMFIFGGLAGISTEGIPQPLFYMSGILLWNYFSDCFSTSNNLLSSYSQMFGKVWFPRLIVPIAGCISSLFKTAIQFILFIVIYISCAFNNPSLQVNVWVLITPLLIVMIALHGMALGLIVTSVTYKYRDLQMLVGFFLQLFMYVTPVVYPLETIPEQYKEIVMLNPLASIFESFKYAYFSIGVMDWGGLLYSAVFMLVMLFFSILVFNQAEATFMDTV